MNAKFYYGIRYYSQTGEYGLLSSVYETREEAEERVRIYRSVCTKTVYEVYAY